jgi:hypothetical protein
MSVLTSAPYHRAVARVSRWCSWYTREVDAQAADIRRDELASDLYEHAVWADQSGATPEAVARAIFSRAVRGAPADLTWRYAQRRKLALADPVGFRVNRVDNAVSALILIVACTVLGWGTFVLARIMLSVMAEQIRPSSPTSLIVAAFTVLTIGAVALLSRRRKRALGAMIMVLPSVGLVHFGLFQLYSLSATVGALTFTMPGWELASTSLSAGLSLFFVAAAIWSWPERRTSSDDTGTRLKTLGEMAR